MPSFLERVYREDILEGGGMYNWGRELGIREEGERDCGGSNEDTVGIVE